LGTRTLEDVLRLLPGFDVVRDTVGRPRIVVRGGGLDGSFGARVACCCCSTVAAQRSHHRQRDERQLDLPVDTCTHRSLVFCKPFDPAPQPADTLEVTYGVVTR